MTESGRPIYRHYGRSGWGELATTDPWAFQLAYLTANQVAGDSYWAGVLAVILFVHLLDPDDLAAADGAAPSSPPTGEPAIVGSATGTPAGSDRAAPSTAAGGACEVRFYHGTPTVKVKDTPGKAKPTLARADFWVQEDCSVRMELVWQAQLIKGWYFMLVASGTGTSTPNRVSSREIEISGEYSGGTSAIDEPCPATDCPGRVDWLRGGNIEAGQVGSYLSAASANAVARVIEDGTLHVEPLTFETGYMTFNVKRLFAEPHGPPAQPEACPAD